MTDALRPNQRRVLAALTRLGEASRAELAIELELPKATVAGLVTDLIGQGRLVETARPGHAAGPGRPGQVVALAGPVPAAAVLTWSAKILHVVIAGLDGRVITDHVAAIPTEASAAQALAATLDALTAAAADAGHDATSLAGLVLSIPAPIQRGAGPRGTAVDTGRRWAWLPGWLHDGLVDELGRRIGVTAVAENDANLGALGEYTFGAGRGQSDQVYVKLGRNTVGAGLILDGRLHRGATGMAGELGHVQIQDDGPLCSCGGRGCVLRIIGADLIDLAQPAYEQPLTFDTVLSLADAGDIGLQRLLTDLGRAVGRPLADLCTLLNPDLFILDGSVGPAGRHIIAGMSDAVDRHARPATAAALRIVAGDLGSHADVLGAVALIRRDRARSLVT